MRLALNPPTEEKDMVQQPYVKFVKALAKADDLPDVGPYGQRRADRLKASAVAKAAQRRAARRMGFVAVSSHK